jgi:ribosomal protein S27E
MIDWVICIECSKPADVHTQTVFDNPFYYYECDTCDEIYARTEDGSWVDSGCVMAWYRKGNNPYLSGGKPPDRRKEDKSRGNIPWDEPYERRRSN